MPIEELYSLAKEDPSYFERFPGRSELLERVERRPVFDIVVVGGGIHGATFARLAAFNGVRTLLLEQRDYASGTSSRSSKMAHGGLRYLEMFDFHQVFEGIRARDDLFEVAPHLVHPHPFLIPVESSSKRWKFKAGLSLYDALLANRSLRHRWIPKAELGKTPFANHALSGCFQYFDGVMDDTRLVLENIVAARQEGAVTLNYARFDSVLQKKDNTLTFGFTDTLSGKKYEAAAGVVVNCAGPWAPTLGRLTKNQGARWSRGTHLLFSKRWEGPALFLPLADKGRYYFVWPHPAGTLVGTTEREVTDLPLDPHPTSDEVTEILERLRRDIPEQELTRKNLHYAFTGIRTLALRGKGKTSELSRRHEWRYGQGILSLIGGKYTTASRTAFEGLKRVFELSFVDGKPEPLTARKLPGGAGYGEPLVRDFMERAKSLRVPESLALGALRRFGSRVLYFTEQDFEPVGSLSLRGEVRIACLVEQTEALEDLLRRRLGTEYFPSHGLDELGALGSVLKEFPGKESLVECGEGEYRTRLHALHRVLQNHDHGSL